MKVLLNSVSGGAMPPSGYGGIERGNSTLVRGLQEIGEEPFLACTNGSTIDCPKLTFESNAPGEYILEACKREWGQFDVIHDGTCNGSIYFPYKESESVFWIVPGCGGDGDLCCYLSKKSMELSPCPNGPLPYTLLGVDPSQFEPKYDKSDYIVFVGSARRDRKYLHYFASIAKTFKRRAIAIISSRVSDMDYVKECYQIWPFAIVDDITDESLKMDFVRYASALVHCSAITPDWQDASPLSVLEALAVGTPVIGNYSGGIPEMIRDGETGFLVDSEEGAIDAFRRIGEIDPRACRAYIEEERDHILYAQRTHKLHEKLAGKSYEERQQVMLRVQEEIDACI